MGETRVDLHHLLEDLRDAYPGSLEETILTEMIANSLDSGADTIRISTDPSQRSLMVLDNGTGMPRRHLSKYHDIAASTKVRGQGIGFAGVGIKLGLLICESVLTETRRGKTHVATVWHLHSRYRAPWKWITPPGSVDGQGTAVRLTLHNALSPLLDPGFVEATLRRHFQPLVDPSFDQILAGSYPRGVQFFINGEPLAKFGSTGLMRSPLEIRLLRKRKPSAVGYLIRDEHPLPVDQRGVAVSTYGKVIKRGWDWLSLSPSAHEYIGGLIEVPELASSLTLNKGDFIRVGSRGAVYLAYRKAIQEAVSRQLTEWGDTRGLTEEVRPRMTRPIERDLERVLEDLTDSFPLLSSLVERRSGGQKRLPLGSGSDAQEGHTLVTALVVTQAEPKEEEPRPTPSGESTLTEEPSESQRDARPAVPPEAILLPGKARSKRPMRLGLDIQFEERPDDREVARLVESTVWVNRAHPAYHRAENSRALGYHVALAIAMALAPLAAQPAEAHAFLTTFLTCWGNRLGQPPSR